MWHSILRFFRRRIARTPYRQRIELEGLEWVWIKGSVPLKPETIRILRDDSIVLVPVRRKP